MEVGSKGSKRDRKHFNDWSIVFRVVRCLCFGESWGTDDDTVSFRATTLYSEAFGKGWKVQILHGFI